MHKKDSGKKLKQGSSPSNKTAELFLTYDCNLRCPYCYIRGRKVAREKQELPFDFWRAIIETLAEHDFRTILFNGGEPFYRQDFGALLEIAEKKCDSIIINTNGTIITNKFIRLIKKSPQKFRITVSLDGPTQELHDFTRGQGSFLKTLKMIGLLSEHKVAFNIATVVMKHNLGSLKDILELAETRGAQELLFLDSMSSVSGSNKYCLDYKSLSKALFTVLKLSAVQGKVSVGKGGLVSFAKKIINWNVLRTANKGEGFSGKCGVDYNNLTGFRVDPYGRLMACPPSFKRTGFYYDLKVSPLKKLLQKQGKGEFPSFTLLPDKIPAVCEGCEYISVCFSGCPLSLKKSLKMTCKFLRSKYNFLCRREKYEKTI
ncbi:MAG: radical SAM protein [Candidatus Saganbacteria bacterium]|nr:radical SAM protein [Candidatus Saganbacteria bacterium]